MASEQPVCCGCMVQPNFLFPTPCPKCDPPFQFPAHPFSYIVPAARLTEEEKEVLFLLKQAWDKFNALGDHVSHDLTEFTYGIHLAQQKLAMRVARRADPDVWSQPQPQSE